MQQFLRDPILLVLGILIAISIGLVSIACAHRYLRSYHWYVVLVFSILLGAVPISIGTKTPNIYYCDLVVIVLVVRAYARSCLSSRANAYGFRRYVSGNFIFLMVMVFLYIIVIVLSVTKSLDPLRSVADIKVVVESFLIVFLVWFDLSNDHTAVLGVLKGLVLFALLFAISTILATYVNLDGQIGLMFTWQKSYVVKDLIALPIGKNNFLGGILAILFPIIVSMLFLSRGISRIYYLVVMTVVLVAVYVTSSGGAAVALIVGISLVILFSLPIRQKLLGIVPIFVASGIFLLRQDLWSIAYEKLYHSFAIRSIQLWQVAWLAFDANPLLGIGRGISRSLYGVSLHNSILTAFVESGIFAGVLLILIMTAVILRGFAVVNRSRRDRRLAPITWALHTSITIGLIHSFGEILMESTLYSIIFWLLVGLLYALTTPKPMVAKVRTLQNKMLNYQCQSTGTVFPTSD